ncbi:hypothetical protein LJ046_00940 [Lactobacillus delbrueckii subsp. jakobsenii ZN7a-9 = DSM 26046]|uniref:glycosyltransferase n=1 Tax=Lactobacillus delbrueckii TaxID=1584 RepID=UPI00032F607C|nr:glycosyltransferase [Lactobacillus delbrueckii]APG72379.1 hypothetical protein LJ046_00940 [Lactobacillus delbrueckii subsp. jakobsenii ZN7a-9 = DSM 26046]EOD02014.1 glycosyltransferase WchA [Lactobacillus delbrueckii subsp. jakobsenii ZN7a-9 = DSM 26046]KRO19424.1 glycosyltransferase WchA [Lactobacillus delbrueckii subsp. jakobsenii ZN7a-9 = DSM 26046]TDG63003.1 hypothetical protein C5L19_001427 [Lactobacillus delbrueckii subsp. jakobsenii]
MKDNTKILTIIIPVYNSEKYITKCIESIVYASSKIEIILIDDGSTDGSGQICDTYSSKFANVKTIHAKNGGVSRARNLGLKSATGKYVWFIDSDDVVLNGVLSKIVNTIVDNDFDIFIFGYVKKENFEGVKGSKNIKIQKLNKEDAIYSLLDPSFATFPWNKIFRRELIVKNNISFPVEMVMCEDMEFCYKAFDKAKRILLTDNKLYGYRENFSGASHNKNISRYKDAAVANFDLCTYIEKNYPKYFSLIVDNTVSAILSYMYYYGDSDDRYNAFNDFITVNIKKCQSLSIKKRIEAKLFLKNRILFDNIANIKRMIKKV